MKISGLKLSKAEMMLAAMVDRLSLLVWLRTEDGREGINRPKSVLSILTGEQSTGTVEAFSDADDYEAEWARITGVKHA